MLYFSRKHMVDRKNGTTPEDILELSILSIQLEPQESVCRRLPGRTDRRFPETGLVIRTGTADHSS